MKKTILLIALTLVTGCIFHKKQNIPNVDAYNETRRVKQFRFGLNTPFLENYQEILKYAQPGSTTYKVAQRNIDAVTSIRKNLIDELNEYKFKPLSKEQAHKELIRIQQDRLIFVYDFENHYKKIVDNLNNKKQLSENEKIDLQKAQDHLKKYEVMIKNLMNDINELQASKI